ncbi:MAG: RNA polymerase sigma factor [Novosphingobium sp.]|nr:RNA polymerase sigma factor [Novosphingobium sp.]
MSLEFSEHTAWGESLSEEFWTNGIVESEDCQLNDQELRKLDFENILASLLPHIPSLKRYLQARVPADDVEDVVQDVLLRIFRRVDLTVLDRPKCYLYQAAQATLIDRHRRQSTRKAMLHCELMDEMHPVDELHPLHILIARDEFRIVEGVLDKLPDRTREIIISVRVEGVSLKALASRYDISISAIEKHVTKALKALEKAKSRQNFSSSQKAVQNCLAA